MSILRRVYPLMIAFVLLCGRGISQDYSIAWGSTIELKQGVSDLEIVAAGNNGLLFREERKRVSSGPAGPVYITNNSLVRLDKEFRLLFRKEYKKELGKLDFEGFHRAGNELYFITSGFDQKERSFIIQAARIDKNSGQLGGDIITLGSYLLEGEATDLRVKMTEMANGSDQLLVCNFSAKGRLSLGVTVLDNSLKEKQNTVLNITFDPGQYQLEDVQVTANNKIAVLGKLYDESGRGPWPKVKYYSLSLFNFEGVKLKEINIGDSDLYITSGKLIQQHTGQLLFAGFYSRNVIMENTAGFLINKIDTDQDAIVLRSYQDIKEKMLGRSYVDSSDIQDLLKTNEDEALPRKYTIRSVELNPADSSIIITSEISRYGHYYFGKAVTSNNISTGQYAANYVDRYISEDILITLVDKTGKIRWINDIPKSQLEEVRVQKASSSKAFYFDNDPGSYFAGSNGMPFHSSFCSVILNNKLVLLFNDHIINNVNPEPGERVRTVTNFRNKSNLYAVSIDLFSGRMTRKMVCSNNEETVLMPRHALVVGNEFIVPSWRQHALAKTELKFARISVK